MPAHSRRAVATRSRVVDREAIVIFAGGLLLNLLAVLVLMRHDIWFPDSVSRTSQASFVLFSRDPHLGAIGLVWNPLPTLAQIPVVALFAWLDRSIFVIGPAFSALFGALSLVVLDRIIRLGGVADAPRRLLLAGYAFNPMVLLYNANGMSESMLLLCLLIAIWLFWRWTRTQDLATFAGLAITGAVMVQVRYEALAFMAALAAALAVSGWRRSPGRSREELEGLSIALLTPAVCSFAVWIFLNWTIMGDPLHFLTSPYGNTHQAAASRAAGEAMLAAAGSIGGSIRYVAERTFALSPFFIPLVALALAIGVRRGRGVVLAIALLTLALPGFHLLMVYRDAVFPWLRFSIYVIPFSIVLLAVLWREVDWFRRNASRPVTIALLGVMLIGTNVSAGLAMESPRLAPEEWAVACRITQPDEGLIAQSMTPWRVLNDYLEIVAPAGSVIMLDAYMGYPLPILSGKLDYVITSDFDFEAAVADPAAHADYILIPSPRGLGVNDRLNREYPDLWSNGHDGFELIARFTNQPGESYPYWGWALYAVSERAQTETFYLGEIQIITGDECRREGSLFERVGLILDRLFVSRN